MANSALADKDARRLGEALEALELVRNNTLKTGVFSHF